MRWNQNVWKLKRRNEILAMVLGISTSVSVIVLLIVIIVSGYSFRWTGFNAQTIAVRPGLQYQQAKTLWDWLQLLIIPAVIAILGIIINRMLDRRNRDTASDKLKEDILQLYFDKMSELLLEKQLLQATKDNEVFHLARARTLTALSGLDIARKARLITFLSEVHLLTLGIDLRDMELKGIDLFQTDLRGISLFLTNLDDSILISCNLSKVMLYGTSLNNAALNGANLSGANLEKADLRGANLSRADLSGANLTNANLRKAILVDAKLDGANLKSAIISKRQLNTVASYDNITQ